jgi:hypothetical protein
MDAATFTEWSMKIGIPLAFLGLYMALYDVTRKESRGGKMVLWFVLGLGTFGYLVKTALLDFGLLNYLMAG